MEGKSLPALKLEKRAYECYLFNMLHPDMMDAIYKDGQDYPTEFEKVDAHIKNLDILIERATKNELANG